MTVQIELTAEELKLIKEQREAAAKKEALEKEQEMKRKAAEDEKLNGKKRLQEALVALDQDNIIKRNELGELYFMLGDDVCEIRIEEHRVYDNSCRFLSRPKNKGWKYLLCGGYTDYKNKYMKKPETVLKNIKEYINHHNAVLVAKEVLQQRIKRTSELLKCKYNGATVKYQEYSNSFIVKKNDVTVDFSSYMKDGCIELSVINIDVSGQQNKLNLAADLLR